jgi:hypothetical protein
MRASSDLAREDISASQIERINPNQKLNSTNDAFELLFKVP